MKHYKKIVKLSVLKTFITGQIPRQKTMLHRTCTNATYMRITMKNSTYNAQQTIARKRHNACTG